MSIHSPASGPREWWTATGLVDFDAERYVPLHVYVGDRAQPEALRMHLHEYLEFGVMLDGQLEKHFGDLVAYLGPGDVWLIDAWEPHAWRVCRPEASFVVLMFFPDVVEDQAFADLPLAGLFTAPPSRRPRKLSPECREAVVAIAREVRGEFLAQPKRWVSSVRLQLLRMLLLIGRHWHADPTPRYVPEQRTGNLARIMPAIDLVRSYPTRRVTIREAAAACELGRTQFQLVFRKTIGLGFARFCRRLRLAFAADWLLSANLPARAIAREAGFTDASHFHHAFTKCYGCTPGQYRRGGIGLPGIPTL
jgi:AraC-like DNA-binding protein